MMNTTPFFLNTESEAMVDYNGHDLLLFDPNLDFSQFLEEARKSRAQASLQSQAQPQKKMPEEGKRKKKSWKTSLFSWIKVDKRSSTAARGSSISHHHASNLRPGSLSGPIYGSGRKSVPSQQVRRAASSGPITNLFMPEKYEEHKKIPYVSLDQLNHPTQPLAYGPVYLVT